MLRSEFDKALQDNPGVEIMLAVRRDYYIELAKVSATVEPDGQGSMKIFIRPNWETTTS